MKAKLRLHSHRLFPKDSSLWGLSLDSAELRLLADANVICPDGGNDAWARLKIQWVDGVLARITEKSSGLLQVISLPIAIFTAVASSMSRPSFMLKLAIVYLLALAIPLLWNLRVVVWKGGPSLYADPIAELDRLCGLCARRSFRLTLAIYGVLVGIFAAIGVTLLSF